MSEYTSNTVVWQQQTVSLATRAGESGEMSNAGYDGWQNDYFDPEPPEDDGSMTSDELSAILREQLADVQHGIWSHWMRYLFSMCQRNEDGSFTIPVDKVKRWERQTGALYGELTEQERESDRHQADKVLAVLAHAQAAEVRTDEAVRHMLEDKKRMMLGGHDVVESMRYNMLLDKGNTKEE